MDLVDLRSLAAGLILGTATALALRGFAPAGSRAARASGWLVPAAAVLPPAVAFALAWHPRGWELERILRGGGFFYGPALITIALFLFGLSRPFARRRGPLARLAGRPLFWILAPYAVALGILGGIALVHPGTANAAGGNATITKTLTAQFNPGTVPAGITTTGDQLALAASTTPAATFTSSANTTATVGVGALTMGGGNPNVFLTLHGGATASSSYYDGAAGTFSAGPALPTGTVNTGAFVVQRSATTYLLVRGGATNGLSIVNTQGVAVGVGACTVAFGVGCWTITNAAFTLTATAGAGAHAIQRTDGRILIVLGNNTRTTNLYTPPGVGTEGVIAGPLVSANVGAGALAIPRTADTNWVEFRGNNSTTVNRYAQTGGTIVGGVDTGTFSATGVTVTPFAVNTGAFALQYTDGSIVGSPVRWLVVLGNADHAIKYDPAGTLNQAYTQVLLDTAFGNYAAGAGGYAFKRGDGTWAVIQPGANTEAIWTPSAATFTAGAFGFSSGNPGAGAHAFQRDDGKVIMVRGGTSNVTDLYDAGWTMTATYQSEQLDPGFVDKWDQLSWTTATANGTTVTTGFRSAATCAANTGAFTTFAASTTGSTAITSPTGNRCIQAEAILDRPVPQQTDATSAWDFVWLGTGGIFYDRAPVASPTLGDYSLRMVLGQFTITAVSPQTAGTAFTGTVTLKDQAAATITDYAGTHALVFSGANAAPNGSVPTWTDGNFFDQPFGADTDLAFTTGATTAATTVKLYKAETAVLGAIENFYAPVAAYYLCGGGTACTADAIVQLTTAVPATVVVNPTAISAANSTLTPVIASVAASAVQPITVTALDSFKNPIPSLAASLSAAPAGPTLSAPGTTNASGVYSGSITTATLGTYTVSATVNAVTITPTLAISFVTTTGKETTATAAKDTQARLANNATVSNANVGAGGVVLNNSVAPSGANLVSGATVLENVGAGAHTLLGSGGQYLTFHGNDTNTTSVYDGSTGFVHGPRLQDTSGAVTVNVPVNFGGHSFKIPSGTNAGRFLLIPGGQGVDVLTANKTLLIDPNGWVVSNGPATLSGPSGTAASGAGAGAFSIAFSDFGGAFASDTRFLIVHAGGVPGGAIPGTTNTSIFDAATNTIVAGPALTAAAGDGAFGIVRPNGTLLVVHGNNTTTTTLYTPAASPGIGTTAAGPAVTAAVSRGGHAIRFTVSGTNCLGASTAGTPCYVIVNGGAAGSTTTTRYDPTLNAFAAGTALTAAAGIGSNTLLQANGNYLVIHGNALATTTVFNPTANTYTAGPALTGAAGIGAHAFQQVDHRYVIFRGGQTNQTNLHSGGWIGKGTYTSEWTDPGNVDSWTALGYTTTLSGGSISIDTQVAQSSAPTGLIAAQTTATLNGANTAALALGSTSDRKWARAVATLTRPVPPFSGEQTGVFLGAGYTVQQRTQQASPTLSALSFTYRTGYFRITAATPQVAGAAFATSGFALVDDTSTGVSSAVIGDYTGTHIVVFSGANTAPNGTSVPTARNASAVDVAFGSNTTITFTAGAGGTTFVLYKAETANPAATETVNGSTCPAPQSCGITAPGTVQTVAPAILVNPANPDAAQSTATVSPSTLPADDVALSTLSIVVKDAFQNLSPGVNSPRRAVSITKSVGTSAVIASPTGNVDASAAYSTTVRDAVAESVTLTIQISSGADVIPTITLTAQPTITFAALTLVVTPVDGSGNPIAGPTVTAGQSFGLKIEAHVVSPSSTDTSFCDGTGSPAATCTLTFTTTAGAAPDGTAPRVATVTISAATFSAGFFTTGLSAFALVCANGNGVVCLSQTGSHTITATAVQVGQTPDTSVTLTGTTSGMTVNTAATNSRNGFTGTALPSFALLSPSLAGCNDPAAPAGAACATATTAGLPQTVEVWARIVDGFGNAAENGRSVTFTTSLGQLNGAGVPVTVATSASTAFTCNTVSCSVLGYAGPVALTSATAGTATIGATQGATPINAATAHFTSLVRINNGTYYGTTATDANTAITTVTKLPIHLVPADGTGKPQLTDPAGGGAFTSAAICWAVSPAPAGTLDAPLGNTPPCPAPNIRTTSGAASYAQYTAATQDTAFSALEPGLATITGRAGNQGGPVIDSFAITVAGYFRVATTTTNGRQLTAFVDWDGTSLRVDAWFAPEP